MIRLKNSSLRTRLTIIVSLAALFIWAIATGVAWFQARKEVDKHFDAQQILFAERLASSNLHRMLEREHPGRFGGFRPPKPMRYDDDALAFAVFDHDGNMLLSDRNKGDYIPFQMKQGFSKSLLTDGDDDPWRIYWLPIDEGRMIIAVGQEIDYRDDLVEDMVLGQMWVWFAGLPLLLFLIMWVINRELKSLKRVSHEVQERSPEDHSLIATEDVPKEVLPLVNNLNRFFNRTSTMLVRERRFTSDAAHELRSPLAALKVQTEIAQLAGEDTELREKALNNLTLGINRASQLIEQLLTLSRLDNLTALEGVEKVEWQKLLPSLVGELYFPAQKRHIELEYEELAQPMARQGQPLLLSLMVRNLVDNAIKYCPEGSTVQIILEKHRLIVQDNGGGVAEEDLAKLGQRFYRPAGQNEKGSGLGLSIVHRIAELHHCRVRLENGELEGKRGLRAIISW